MRSDITHHYFMNLCTGDDEDEFKIFVRNYAIVIKGLLFQCNNINFEYFGEKRIEFAKKMNFDSNLNVVYERTPLELYLSDPETMSSILKDLTNYSIKFIFIIDESVRDDDLKKLLELITCISQISIIEPNITMEIFTKDVGMYNFYKELEIDFNGKHSTG